MQMMDGEEVDGWMDRSMDIRVDEYIFGNTVFVGTCVR